MKIFEIILIVAIIGYCFTDTDDECSTKFNNLLEEKCKAISSSCTYSSNDDQNFCIKTGSCESTSKDDCASTVPTNFHLQKCVVDNSNNCKTVSKTCADYNKIGGSSAYSYNKDDCSLLSADAGKYCYLTGSSCVQYFEECKDASYTSCGSNIPKNHSQICTPGTNSENQQICKANDRDCSNPIQRDKNNCFGLKTSNLDKLKCIYDWTTLNCEERYLSCELIETGGVESVCDVHSPLNSEKNDFDYTKKCTYNKDIRDSVKCKAVPRKCTDIHTPIHVPTELINETFCKELEVSDEDYYKCAYDGSNGCHEVYKDCDSYNTNFEKERSECENIVLENKNEKCVYDEIEDKCVTKTIYTNCTAYPGKDKKICESILSSGNNQYCILDKDSECIEKPINCSEAYSEEDCLHIAKPSDSNKRCVWGNPNYSPTSSLGRRCYEEFVRCEDYTDKSDFGAQKCEYIKLYDGKICELIPSNIDSNGRCTSKFKTCGQAKTEEECKLIAKTGVTDPERKVCDWIMRNSSDPGICLENYKYCSDYRDNNTDSKCTRIKPYDASGNNIDYGFICKYDSNIGCYKVTVECENAHNPIECASFNDYIIDKDKLHCVYYGGQCITQYRQCEFVDLDKVGSKCGTNIIEGYIINACTIGSDGKCEKSGNKCSSFKKPSTTSLPDYMEKYYTGLCQSINHTCKYDNGNCIFAPEECKETIFYSNDTDKNKEYCENLQVDKPYKKCVLKEDFSGCKEVYIETDYSTANTSYSAPPDASTQGNSSGFIVKGIYIIIALLVLLI